METAASRRQANLPDAPAGGKGSAIVGAVCWERMIRAVERVRERLRRAVAALKAAGVPYAVAGGNAVAAWRRAMREVYSAVFHN